MDTTNLYKENFHMKRIFWILTLALLSLALVACGGGEEAAPAETAPAAANTNSESAAPAATEAPTAEPTAVPAPTAEPSPTAEPQSAKISFAELNPNNRPENLDSYRYDMILTMSGVNDQGEAVSQSMTMQMAHTADPKASSITMVTEGVADMGDIGNLEMVQIGDTNYMVLPGMGCINLPAEGEDLLQNSMTDAFTPEEMFNNLENLTLVGEETIDDIRVLHYTFDETAVPAADAQGLQSMQGDVFIAKDGGYLVRMSVDMQGDTTFLQGFEGVNDAVMHVEFNLKDINQPFEITLPASCADQGANAEPPFPVVEGATDLVNFAGIMGYSVNMPLADVIAFYQEQMPAAGYTYAEDQSFIADEAASLSFTGDSGTALVTLSETDGVTSVTILADSGQ